MVAQNRSETVLGPVHSHTWIGFALAVRFFGWGSIAALGAFSLNNYLTYWHGWPGPLGTDTESSGLRSSIQVSFYVLAFIAASAYVLKHRYRSLDSERDRVFRVNSLIIRTAFWAVLLIGITDFSLAFLNGEELLNDVVGPTFADSLMRAEFRGAYVHTSLIGVSLFIAVLVRMIGVPWLALLIFVSELLIVLSRFVFSYEQDYMADLVRFWYAALIILGCAYTLREDGHVRVDVIYARFTPKTKGMVNAIGALLLAMPFTWLILIVGTSGHTGIINSALLKYEIEGLGNSLYVFYLMTVFVGVFAITMLIEFVGSIFGAMSDCLAPQTSNNGSELRRR